MNRRPRLIDCPGCGRTVAIHAGGQCAACYQRSRRQRVLCEICGEYGLCYTHTCLRCQRRRRAVGGTCTECGRQVARLWGRRCALCAHTSWTVGSCTDCCAWAASIADGRCRACRDFTRRNSLGACRSCQRSLPINRHGRCRLCTTARRDARLSGDPGWKIEPGQRDGIQLFLGDRSAPLQRTGPSDSAPPQPAPQPEPTTLTVPDDDPNDEIQLQLFAVFPKPADADSAAHAWLTSPRGAKLTADVAAFAQTRGWPPATSRGVQRGLALVAVTNPDFDLNPAIRTALRQRYVSLVRLREFLAATELTPAPAPRPPGQRIEQIIGELPAPMIKEITAWVATLSGAHGRGRPRSMTTIDSYLRAIRPALRHWGQRYPTLRQVTDDDITAHLQPLRGSHRTHTAVALRSLFSTLKTRRLIFANPARRTRPGKFPRRPILGLTDATRAGLLADLDRADHRLVVLLAAVHALSRSDIATLRLDHINPRERTITVRGKPRPLDTLTHDHLLAWLHQRRQRWPATANTHLLLTSRSALGVGPVSTGYFRGLPLAVSQLRADRLLTQARDTGGDALTLIHLFGLGDDAAVRYCTELDFLDTAPAAHAPDGPRR
jgi:hypothetical protein